MIIGVARGLRSRSLLCCALLAYLSHISDIECRILEGRLCR